MRTTDRALVGRERELEELASALGHAISGHGCLFTIEGEPGVGKTRLAEEFCSLARRQGALVLWSRCSKASGAPVYWPWIQIIRACLGLIVGRDFYSRIEEAINDIAEILPDACRGLPTAPRGDGALEPDPEQVRFRLSEAVRFLLQSACEVKPIVVVVDELGSADKPSLLMLQFLARELHGSRILILSSYRRSDLHNSAALAEAIGELARDGTSIVLHGLNPEQTARMLAQHGISNPEFCAGLHRASGGNPFLIASVLKVCKPEDWHNPSRFRCAGAITAALEAHFGALSQDARRILTVAAVLGEEFDAAVLERALHLPAGEMLDFLAQAEGAGLLAKAPEMHGHGYRFVHSLVRDALYEGVRPLERARLHRRLAQAIEELYARDLEVHLSDLAHHFFAGAGAGSAARALDYAQRAAERATELAAFEEATRWYRMALGAMEMLRSSDRPRQCEILLAMGDAQNRSADYDGARETFRQVAELAARLRDGELLARAALGYPGLQWGSAAAANEEAISLLERALKALPKHAEAWRAMLMARLASELYHRPAAARRREELAGAAVRIGRRIGDKHALLAILGHRDLTLSGPDTLRERLANAEEMTQVAEEIGSYLGLYMGFLSRTVYFRHLGDLPRAEAEAQAMGLLASTTRLPVCTWGARCFAAVRALMEGRFDEGEKLARECLSFAERMRGEEASDLFWPAMIVAMRERGRLAELESAAAHTVARRPTFVAYRAFLALIKLAQGKLVAARGDFEILAAHRFAEIPHDNMFLACVSALAEVCAVLDDTERAGELLRLLKPYSELVAEFGPMGSFGAVARYLGLLASACSRFGEAQDYFDNALAVSRRMNAPVYVAYTQADYAQMLLRRGSARDRARAREMISLAAGTAEHCAMNALAQRLQELRADSERTAPAAELSVSLPALLPGPPQHPNGALSEFAVSLETPRAIPMTDSAQAPDPRLALFRREGDYWTICYGGKVFRIRHVKGLACLAYLLGHPTTEVHSASLAAVMERSFGAVDISPLPAVSISDAELGTAGPMLDGQAKAAYRLRLGELREELEDAHAMNDPGRADRAQREIEFLTAEISRAVGLGGRDRQAASASERARLNVTKAIKAVLAKIQQHDCSLGQHLDATIRTGTFCSYRPDPAAPIFWKLS